MIAQEGKLWLTLPCPAILSDLWESPRALFRDGQMRRREPALTLPLGKPVEVDEFEALKALTVYIGATVSEYDEEGPVLATKAEELARRRKYDQIWARVWKVYGHPAFRDGTQEELGRVLLNETQKTAAEICWILTLVSSFDMPSLEKLH
jgi:hypothetical protein